MLGVGSCMHAQGAHPPARPMLRTYFEVHDELTQNVVRKVDRQRACVASPQQVDNPNVGAKTSKDTASHTRDRAPERRADKNWSWAPCVRSKRWRAERTHALANGLVAKNES